MNNDDDDIFKIDPETAWLETVTIGGFRVWHIIAFCLGIVLSIIIMVCCCIRFRIPRTKQEIEADYQRKQITKKFHEKLQQIKNSDMDNMDLQKGIIMHYYYVNVYLSMLIGIYEYISRFMQIHFNVSQPIN
ncbi:hypothetical protein GQX74_009234 [Glossina fuscipes]|nr:hypothetical protein GQX74_009234 [Glossina fuscipes]